MNTKNNRLCPWLVCSQRWLSLFITAVVCLLNINIAKADNGTWANLATGGLWSNTANWSGGVIADGTGSSADFSTLNLTAHNTVLFDAPHTLTSLTFGDTTSTYYNWTLSNNGSDANVLTLAGTSPSITVKTGYLTNNVVIAGSGGFSVNGSSTVTSGMVLGAANTFTGDVFVNTGTGSSINMGLYLNNAGALGGAASSSAVYLVCNAANRAVLYLNAAGVYSYSNNLIMRPTAASASSRGEFRVAIANSTNTWNGNVFLDGVSGSSLSLCDIYCDGTSSMLTINGNISSTNNFIGTMDLRGAATGIIKGSINMPGASLGKNDGGTWTINSANGVWSNTVVQCGTLKLGIDNVLPINTAITMGGGAGTAYLDLNGYSQVLSNNVVHNGGNPERIINSSSALSLLTYSNSANVACGVVISGNISLVKSDVGTLTLSAADTYTGNTVISNGTLAVSSAGAISRSTNIIIGAGTTFAPTSISFAAGQNLKPVDQTSIIAGTVNLSSGTLVLNYTNETPALTVSNGNLVLSSASVAVINVSGSLASGQLYKLVSAAGTGQVSGTMPVSVTLNGAGGQAGSLVVSNSELYLSTSPTPFITSQMPALYTNHFILFAGASLSVSVTVGGLSPFGYQWFTNGVPDGTAVSSSMSWSNVPVGSLSVYCVVTNSYGSATSAVWSASVIAVPTNPYPTAVVSDSPVGYWRLNESDNGLGNYNAGVIANDYMGGNNGIYTNTDLGLGGYSQSTDSGETSALFGYETLNNGVAYGIEGVDFATSAGTSKTFTIEAWVNAYTPISDSGIVAKGYGSGGEQFVLDTGGTSHGFRFLIRTASGTASVASSSIVPDYGTWHHLVGVCDEPHALVSLYVDGQKAATASIATNGGILASTSPMSIGARYSSSATMSANNYDSQYAGNINDVAVYNTALSLNQVQAHYFASGAAPIITLQPVASTNAYQNGPLTIAAAANGTQPLSYSWFDVNANSYISGQTNATLEISSVTSNDSYYLTVANAYGTTNSSVVTVIMYSGLNASLTPNTNLTLYAGRTVSYNANALGTYPIYFQWYENEVPVPAATNGIFNLPVTVGSNSISCVVSNSYNGYSSMVLGPVGLAGVVAPTNLYQVTILSNNPVAYWPLSEADDALNDGNPGAVAYDYIGGHNATYTNVDLGLAWGNTNEYPTLTAALFGAFASSNSVAVENDYSADGLANINFAQSAGGNAAFSVEAWVDLTTASQAASIVAKGNGHSEQFALDVYNGGFRFVIREASGTAHDSGVSGAATVGKWYHVVGVWDGPNGAARVYVNGVNATSNTGLSTGIGLWTPAVNSNLPGGSLVTIGARPSSATATAYDVQFPGKIANVAIYGYVLSTNQIVADYSSGTNAPVVAPPTPGILTITNLSGGQAQLIWNFSGTLQSATNVAGPYNAETNALSPYTIPATNAQMFYRIRQQ